LYLLNVTIRVSEVKENDRLHEWLIVRNELEPEDPLLFEQLLARRAAEPQRVELIAASEDDIVAIGSVGPKGSPPDLAYGYIGVRDGAKNLGAEVALLDTVRERARELGRSRLELWAREEDDYFIALLNEHGFREVMRERGLARDIPGAPLMVVPRPEGITLENVEGRADLGDGAYDVAHETWRDIPGETGIEEREAWLSLHVDGAAGGAIVALHEEQVIGFAGLHQLAVEGLYEHGLLAVLPQYRRSGVARAMKLAQLAWLNDHDAHRVVTWNSETNHAARALNLSLGYQPLLSSIAFHGPVWHAPEEIS